MQNTTSIEVKCECKIPFHAELVAYLQKLVTCSVQDQQNPSDVPHRKEICQAIHKKMVFIRINFAHLKQLRPTLLKAFQLMLNKDVIGTIRVGKEEITFILL